jgi:FkbM family methyltransferase
MSLNFKSIGRRLAAEVADLYEFGPRFMLHHVARAMRREVLVVPVQGGTMEARPGNSDIQTISQVFGRREYDLASIGAFSRINARYLEILESGRKPIIVDAGANIGAATRWFETLFPQAIIVAVEPDPGNAAVLRRNAPSAVVFEAAIGASGGHVSLTGYDQGWAVETHRAEAGCPVVTMDQAFAAVRGGEPFIAKIDIEGFEEDLFSANLDWLDEVTVTIIEPHDWRFPGRGTSRKFQQAFGIRPFELYLKGENLIYVRL